MTTSYGYDALNRLTSASSTDGHSDSRTFDAVGNATSVTIDGVQSTGTYDAANELTAFGDATYTYDTNGNRLTATTSGVTTTYGYDARNELVSLSGPVTASYTYNGAGERVSKTVGGTTTNYTWDPTGLGTVIADETVENVFGPIGLAEQITDSSQTSQFAGADALGTIRLITDGSGTVVGTGSYSPWGVPDSGSMTLNGFGFTGEQVDSESGFVYLRNRFYDPTTSRFLTPDPLGAVGSGVNLYAYVGNDPATLTDPSGLACPECPGSAGGVGGGGGSGGVGGGGGGIEPPVVLPAPEGGYPEDFIGPKLETPPAGPQLYEGEGGTYCPVTEGPPATDTGSTAGNTPPGIKPGSAGGPTAGNPFPESVKNAARAADPSETCVYCRRPGTGTQVDHAIPRARGGNATEDNAQLACPHCNASKGAGDFPKTPPLGYRGVWPPPWWKGPQ